MIIVKRIEQILIKVIIIQFVFLLLTQLMFHQLDIMPKLNQLTKYEGVNESTLTEILQTFQRGK
ncbi:YpfB family protein [Neobacillus dielmonensis]|uniref:YpfB family protein n=1 Tax=Neobacillus dielmonensis TaxID=1347369 RepID=UPI0029E824C4|nr:YpfB family protein [Neobacillus dielmonensis]